MACRPAVCSASAPRAAAPPPPPPHLRGLPRPPPPRPHCPAPRSESRCHLLPLSLPNSLVAVGLLLLAIVLRHFLYHCRYRLTCRHASPAEGEEEGERKEREGREGGGKRKGRRERTHMSVGPHVFV
uniref:Uncharacterized protein n=1 Tax=Oryza rufipogon TaxID=4529 RepID=A0A0E0PPE5_ORYRU